jgi:hypothetical protein
VIVAALVVLVGQQAVARGDLRKLVTYADHVELRVRLGARNRLSPAALRELKGWPSTPQLELRLPVTRTEAAQLKKLKFIAQLARGKPRDPTLKRLRGSVLAVHAGPQAPLPIKDQPCTNVVLLGRDEVLSAPDGVDECVLGWLAEHAR